MWILFPGFGILNFNLESSCVQIFATKRQINGHLLPIGGLSGKSVYSAFQHHTNGLIIAREIVCESNLAPEYWCFCDLDVIGCSVNQQHTDAGANGAIGLGVLKYDGNHIPVFVKILAPLFLNRGVSRGNLHPFLVLQ